MSVPTSTGSLKRSWWSRLQVRMTISYLMVATSTALFLELAVAIGIFLALSALLTNAVPIVARNTARVYAMQAAFQASSTSLNPRSTFQPGQPASLALSGGDHSGESASFLSRSLCGARRSEYWESCMFRCLLPLLERSCWPLLKDG